jgi:nucleosome binding factor SPN SPT16 subunit
VVLCSLGARYKSYCASISRTFLVDVPSKIENLYNILLSLYNRCLESMIKGIELKEVYENAKKYLNEKDSSLLAYLPKSLGFSIGLEFRDSSLVLNGTNTTKFVPGMVFNLSIGFHNIPLTEDDTKGCPEAVKKLSVFSLLIADIVTIKEEGVPEVLTKLSKEFSDISYKIGDPDGEGADGESDGESDEENVGTEVIDGVRRSTRAREEKAANEVASSRRNERQMEIMKKKLEEGKRRVNQNGVNGNNEKENIHEIAEIEAKDLQIYKSIEEYPRDLINNRLKVDLDKEVLFVPINGRHIPFHVSTIKSITQPDPEMRVNFFVPGQALGKEVAKNMQYLVAKYGGTNIFIKELTFRSHDGKNLSSVYQQFQELRRRVRQREQKAEQEKDLVIQTKLIRIKDQRVPRLQEVTIRPQLSGRKCVGTLEAHQNGLRFTSSKAEILDVMYTNIKHAIFQPCDRTTMVLVHFHLKDFIMIGRKKVKDVQFYTEVIEASLNLEGSRRSAYDPDELDDEQREREMRKRLNLAFKEFCSKVEKVAAHYDYNLQIDVPFKKSGFEGNWAKEMVLLQPTTHCLVNLTEWPPFVVTLSDVEHCHMERVTYATKNFDLTFIFKDWLIQPRTITAIDTKYMDIIQDWLNLVEITCTKGPRTINWTDVMKIVRESKDIFYDDHDEYGDSKPAGWLFLSAEASDTEDDEEENADSDFSEDNDDDSSEESASDEDDSDLYDESEDDSDGYDEEDELEEKGQVQILPFLVVFF